MFAGAFGVAVTYLLSLPINLLLRHLTGVSSLAALPLWQGLFNLINDYFDGTTIADLMASSQDGDNYII